MGTRSLHEPVVYALLLALLVGPVATAQPAAEPAPYQPPVLSFDGGRIDLMEAVRLTLQHDPTLLLADEDTNLRAGVVQEIAGAFDWTLTGQVQYQHREQELSEGVKGAERAKRDQVDLATNLIACPSQLQAEQSLEQLLAAKAADPRIADSVIPSTPDEFALQLGLLESLIQANPDNPELQARLIEERLNFIDAEIAVTRAALDGAEGREGLREACRRGREALEALGAVPEEEEFDQAQLQLRLEKLTRTGILLAPFLTGNFNSTEFIGKRSGSFEVTGFSPTLGIPIEELQGAELGGKNAGDTYTVEVGFDVNIPLLRNRGRLAVAGPEIAAGIDYDASELTLAHTASESALNTAFAFWNLVATQERLRVLETSVGLQGQVVDVTRRLIEADELPAAESARGLAGEANARAQLEGAQRDLIAAKVNLVRAMGLSIEGEQNIPDAEGGFPPPPNRAEVERLLEAELVQQGVANRLDLQSARKLVESGGILADAARINLKPRFNLLGNVSAIGRGEGSVSEATNDFKAPNFRIGASLEKPFGNNAQRGRLVQAEARERQSEISAADLERQIRLEVVRTLGSLLAAIDALAQAEAAGESFERTVAAEFEKLRIGESTLLDTVITEQQRTQALLGVVAARQQVANLASQLRFETGTLVGREAEENRITWESLTTLPGGEAGS
ncbi:MAG TPA: TolC family protein [Thermoanaerobaculia bacterium]|nr:TolC family protein [Thermoanaerobaculia bacterium]